MKRIVSLALAMLALVSTSVQAQTPADIQDAIRHVQAALADLQHPTTALNTMSNLQAALDAAQCGDVLTLPIFGTYYGDFTFTHACATNPITLRSADPLPAGRVTSGAVLPALVPSAGVSETVNISGDGLMLRGLDVASPYYNAIVNSGHHIVIDQCRIHGAPIGDFARGIALNGGDVTVSNSMVTEFHANGRDSQAIDGWDGPGPFTIDNNDLEAASEGVLFGGADPSTPGLVPSNITITNNLITKPLAWRLVSAARNWNVKNGLELKNAAHVLIQHNIIEHVWSDAQAGYVLVLTVRNQDGHCPWCTISDVRVLENVWRHAGAFCNILAVDDTHPSGQAAGIVLRGNLAYDIDAGTWKGAAVAAGRLLQVLNGVNGLTVDHNTMIGGTYVNSLVDFVNGSAPLQGFTYTSNVGQEGDYGILGQGDLLAIGTSVLTHYAPGFIWTGNTILVGGGNGGYSYPTGTVVSSVGQRVVNPDFTLAPGFTGGADVGLLKASIAGLDLTQ